VVTIAPQTHLMMIIDLMIKKHIRRLPVVEEGRIVGIVYISDLFYTIMERFGDNFCLSDDLLETAIKTMIHSDIHRLFVKAKDSETIVGVLSLSDAARHRSGSCHACISSRIQLDG
jgi:CBS domain-containing protein